MMLRNQHDIFCTRVAERIRPLMGVPLLQTFFEWLLEGSVRTIAVSLCVKLRRRGTRHFDRVRVPFGIRRHRNSAIVILLECIRDAAEARGKRWNCPNPPMNKDAKLCIVVPLRHWACVQGSKITFILHYASSVRCFSGLKDICTLISAESQFVLRTACEIWARFGIASQSHAIPRPGSTGAIASPFSMRRVLVVISSSCGMYSTHRPLGTAQASETCSSIKKCGATATLNASAR